MARFVVSHHSSHSRVSESCACVDAQDSDAGNYGAALIGCGALAAAGVGVAIDRYHRYATALRGCACMTMGALAFVLFR